jgi:DnaJ-class molecular chaperone
MARPMKFQDYYEVLGVPRTASPDEIRKAYRKLALQWHPDRHKGAAQADAEERFKRISEAYEVLSDPEKRGKYDQFGEHWKHGQEFTPPPGAGGRTRSMTPEEFEQMFGGAAGGFSDFFTGMFGDQFRQASGGAGRHRRFRMRGADVQAELQLSVREGLGGGKRRFELPTTAPCPRCGGVGFLGEHVCPTCMGVGQVHGRKTVEVGIPRSLRDGQTLRLRGLGEPGDAGGEPGDLLLTVRLVSDDVYRIDGADVYADVPVAPWEALAGTKLDVRTPDGVITLTVPAGTRAGQKLRLRGKGLDDGQGGRGDFYAVVRLALPEVLNERQRQLIKELSLAGPSAVAGGAREAAP